MGKKNSRKTAILQSPQKDTSANTQKQDYFFNFKGQSFNDKGNKTQTLKKKPTDFQVDLQMSQQRISSLTIDDSTKNFMNLWNSYLIRNNIKILKSMTLMDKHDVTLTILGFFSQHGHQVRRKYSKQFIFHALTLYDYGYLTLESMMKCIEMLNITGDLMIKKQSASLVSDSQNSLTSSIPH